MKAGTKAGTEAEREWAALAVAALGAALAGLAVSTVRDPWYLTVAITAAVGIFLVAAAMLVGRSVLRRRQRPDDLSRPVGRPDL